MQNEGKDLMNLPKILGKKGQLQMLTSAGFAFLVIAVVLMVAAIIVAEMQDTNAVWNTSAANTTASNTLTALAEISSWLVIIAIVLVAAVILQVVLRGFGRAAGR